MGYGLLSSPDIWNFCWCSTRTVQTIPCHIIITHYTGVLCSD